MSADERAEITLLARPDSNLGTVPERREYELETPVKVQCPFCEREGRTGDRVNLCGGCGAYFEVASEE
jgi:hypothetical protein